MCLPQLQGRGTFLSGLGISSPVRVAFLLQKPYIVLETYLFFGGGRMCEAPPTVRLPLPKKGRNKLTMPKTQKNWCRTERAALKKEFGGKCEFCGATRNLEFAHKRKSNLGSGRGCAKRVRMVQDYPSGFLLLCEKCHEEYDSA